MGNALSRKILDDLKKVKEFRFRNSRRLNEIVLLNNGAVARYLKDQYYLRYKTLKTQIMEEHKMYLYPYLAITHKLLIDLSPDHVAHFIQCIDEVFEGTLSLTMIYELLDYTETIEASRRKAAAREAAARKADRREEARKEPDEIARRKAAREELEERMLAL